MTCRKTTKTENLKCRPPMRSAEKATMLWNEILALQSLEKTLQQRLQGNVLTILDHLIAAGVFEGGSIECAIIAHVYLIHQQQVSELLRQLIARRGHDSGDARSSAFAAFCNVLRNIKDADVAEMLEATAEECKRNGSPEKSSMCTLCRPRVTAEVDDLSLKLSQQKVGAAKDQTPVEQYRKHLAKLCEVESRSSNMTPSLESAEDSYVSMTAMTQREALRLVSRHGKRRNRTSTLLRDAGDDASNSFELRQPMQLLMRDPRLSQSPHQGGNEAMAGSGTASKTHGKTKLVKSCMIMSGAGKGKTMLCRQVMAEFANEEKRDGVHEHFDFVIPISCGDADRLTSRNWSDFLGLDHPNLMLTAEDRKEILQHLAANSERVLLLLDGIDEAERDAFQFTSAAGEFVDQRNSLLLNASVIATSRPCEKAYELVQQCMAHYRLTGFTATQLKDFCQRQLDEEDGAKCVSQLSQPSCKHLKQAVQNTPLLAALLCQQFSKTETVPSCITSFYETFVCSSISQLEKKRGKKFSKVRLSQNVTVGGNGDDRAGEYSYKCGQAVSVHTVIENKLERFVNQDGATDETSDGVELVNALCHMYDLSLKSLRRKRVWIQSSAMPEKSLSLCKALGFLLSTDDHDSSAHGDEKMKLLHLTLQEWCAARSCGMSADVNKTVLQCVNDVGLGEETWPFWRFVAGSVNVECVPSLIEAMQKSCVMEAGIHQRRFTLFLMICLLESKLSVAGANISASHMQHYPDLLKSALFLAADEISVRDIHLDDADIAALANVLNLVPELKTLNVSNCNLSTEQITELAPFLAKCLKIEFEGNSLSGAPLAVIATALSQSSVPCRVEEICVRCTSLVESDGMSLCKVLQLATLREVYVSGNQLGNGGLETLMRSRSYGDSITLLDLQTCGFTDGCGPKLATLVQALPNLEVLDLNENMLKNSDAEALLYGLHHHQHIEYLHLQQNLLDDDVSDRLIKFFEVRHSRELSKATNGVESTSTPPRLHIYLSGNDVTLALLQHLATSGCCGSDVVFTAGHYFTSTKVHRWDIPELVSHDGGNLTRNVSDEMMQSVGEYLATDTVLTTLQLMSNGISDVGATALATHGLVNNSTLRYLNMGGNCTRLTGAAEVVNALKQSSLKCLTLTDNPIFEDITTGIDSYRMLMLALPLCGHQSLRVLGLGRTKMTDTVAVEILANLKDHQSLEVLLLDKNELGDSTAQELVKMKTVNVSLKLFSLLDNQVSEAGIQHLLDSSHVMSMDRVWVGGNPGSCVHTYPPLTNARDSLSEEYILDFTN